MQLQYIGARYVPKWYVNSVDQTADWQINVEYEPLTWVTTQNNHLYLSKKQVPDNIGNPADNTEYWLDMGVFSGNWSQLQQEIEDMQDGTIPGSLQYQIDQLSTPDADNVSYDNTVSGLAATNVQEAIDEIATGTPTPVTPEITYRDYAIYIGNSIASGTGSTGNDNGVYERTKSFFKDSKLFSGSGTAWYDYDNAHSDDTYETHLDDAIADTSVDNSKVTCIMIIGAHGDSRCVAIARRDNYNVISNFLTATQSFATKAKAAFPNLKRIIYINADCRKQNAITVNNLTYYAADSYDLNYYLGASLTIAGIENLGNCGHAINFVTDDFTSDNYHPNDAGYSRLSNMILQVLGGGQITRVISVYFDIGIAPWTGITGSALHVKSRITAETSEVDLTYITVPSGTFAIALGEFPLDIPNDPDRPLIIGKNSAGNNLTTWCLDGKMLVVTPERNAIKFAIVGSGEYGASKTMNIGLHIVS